MANSMFRSTGVDLGTTGTRRVSVGMFWGDPSRGDDGGRQTASVPSDILTFRKVGLPPAGRAVCRRVVQEELAYSLPFPLEEAAWDYSGSPGQEAWVVVAPLVRLASIRQLAGETASLDVEPLAYLRAAQASGVRSALIIDFGATKTIFCAVLPGQLEWVRVMLRGGRALTQRVATAEKCSLERAEEQKRDRGCTLDVCRAFVEELLDEIPLNTPFPYDKILLCGGAAGMQGLAAVIRSRYHIEPELFPLPAPLTPFEDVVAYGTALSERFGQPKIRMVSSSTGGAADYGALRWRAILVFAVLCALLAVFQTETRLATARARQRVQTAELQALLTGHVKVADFKDPDKIVKRIKTAVSERRALRAQSLQNVLDSLAKSAGPVRDVPSADVRSLTFDGTKFQMQGQTASLKDSEKLRESLSKLFGDVQQNKSGPGEGGRRVYEFEWKLPEP